jgi:hypothetical protein
MFAALLAVDISKVVAAVVNLAIRSHVGVQPAGMLHVPVKILRLGPGMRNPLVPGGVHVTALGTTRRILQPVRTRWRERVPPAAGQQLPRVLARPTAAVAHGVCLGATAKSIADRNPGIIISYICQVGFRTTAEDLAP